MAQPVYIVDPDPEEGCLTGLVVIAAFAVGGLAAYILTDAADLEKGVRLALVVGSSLGVGIVGVLLRKVLAVLLVVLFTAGVMGTCGVWLYDLM